MNRSNFDRHRPLLRGVLAVGSIAALVLAHFSSAHAQSPQERLDEAKRRLQQEFSPVGAWTITKMELHSEFAKFHSGAKVIWNLKSSLNGLGSFEISPTGRVQGQGAATYTVKVVAGQGVPTPVPLSLQGTVAGGGVREFTISGSADFDKKIVSLNAAKPGDEPLLLDVPVFEEPLEWPPWPPMTNVTAEYQVVGASLVMRANGTVGKFVASFEAVKNVDLDSVFGDLVGALEGVVAEQDRIQRQVIDPLKQQVARQQQAIESLQSRQQETERHVADLQRASDDTQQALTQIEQQQQTDQRRIEQLGERLDRQQQQLERLASP